MPQPPKEPVLTEDQKKALADGQHIAARIAANVDKVGSGLAWCVGADQYKGAKFGTSGLDPSGVAVLPGHVEGVGTGVFSNDNIVADLKMALRMNEGDDEIRILNPQEGWHCTDWTYLPGVPAAATATQAALQNRLASLVAAGDNTDTHMVAEYKGGHLTVTREDGDLGNDPTIDGYRVLGNFVPQAFAAVTPLKVVTVQEFATVDDAAGNPHHRKIGEFVVSRAKNQRINWDRVTSRNLVQVIDRAWQAPGIPFANPDE